MAMLKSTPEVDANARWRLVEPLIRLKPEFIALEDDRERQRVFEEVVEVHVISLDSDWP